MWRRLEKAAPALVLVAVLATLAALAASLTKGGRAFTWEGWRRLSIREAPVMLPDMAFVDEQGREGRLRDLCGRPMVIDFIYTRCPGVCSVAGALSSQLAHRLRRAGLDASVLSVSVDPSHDSPALLAAYKRRSEAEPSAWRTLVPVHRQELDRLLRQLQVVVVPDGAGGFEHNAALHLVDRQCRLAEVVELENIDAAQAFLVAQ